MEYQRSNIRIERNAFGLLVAGLILTTGFTRPTAPNFNKQSYLTAGKSEPVAVGLIKSATQVKVEPMKEITAEVETEVQAIAPTPAAAERPVAQVTGTNDAMQFIFAHESSNNPAAIAPNGACGLGQAWPCSKLIAACGSLDNVDCQIQFFTDYANRYGGWSGSYAFWLEHGWW